MKERKTWRRPRQINIRQDTADSGNQMNLLHISPGNDRVACESEVGRVGWHIGWYLCYEIPPILIQGRFDLGIRNVGHRKRILDSGAHVSMHERDERDTMGRRAGVCEGSGDLVEGLVGGGELAEAKVGRTRRLGRHNAGDKGIRVCHSVQEGELDWSKRRGP